MSDEAILTEDGQPATPAKEGALAKLKSRTEWQSFLVMVAVTFANHFLGWDISAETLTQLWAGQVGYGISRGLAKKS